MKLVPSLHDCGLTYSVCVVDYLTVAFDGGLILYSLLIVLVLRVQKNYS